MLTVTEVAKLLDISKVTVNNYITKGILYAQTDSNGFFLIHESEVERLKIDFHYDEKLYTLSEVARILELPRPQTLSVYVKNGKIDSYLLPNGKTMIPHREVERLRKNLKTTSTVVRVSSLVK